MSIPVAYFQRKMSVNPFVNFRAVNMSCWQVSELIRQTKSTANHT